MIPYLPQAGSFIDNGQLSKQAVQWLDFIWKAANSATESGTTAQRPTTGLWIGRQFYDTTLNKPVFVNAVTPAIVWKDAAGTTV